LFALKVVKFKLGMKMVFSLKLKGTAVNEERAMHGRKSKIHSGS
jgi:hypothetical protein